MEPAAPVAAEIISAGDLEKFGYCPLSWWLSRGLASDETPSTREGTDRHQEISEDIRGIEREEHRAREAETGVLYFAIAATLVATVGLTFVFGGLLQVSWGLSAIALIWLLAALFFLYRAEGLATQQERLLSERILLVCAMAASVIAVAALSVPGVPDANLAKVLEATALTWLVGASVFLYRSLRALEVARATRSRYGVTGDVQYVDLDREKPRLFISDRHGLSGRPDMVVVEGDHRIPVEFKTGRVPRGPLFSHILQVAAYCLLIEDEDGRMPPYGILRYGDVSHEIDYNEDLKRLVLRKLGEMRAASKVGGAHRNHNRPGKCLNCSRRSGCPERLA